MVPSQAGDGYDPSYPANVRLTPVFQSYSGFLFAYQQSRA